MNIREDSTIRAPSPSGKDDICAKFTIDTVNEPFVLHDIAQVGQKYTLSFWAYSETDGEITAGNVDMPISSEWTRYVVTFIAESVDVAIYFNIAGTYYLYNTQLEIGCKATDFALNPADTEEDVAALAVVVNSHSTQFTVMDGKIAGLIEENTTIRGEYDTLVDRTADLELSLDEYKVTVSENYSTKAELETVDGKVTTLEEWQSEASQKITKDGIIATVGNYYAYQSDLDTVENRVAEAESQILQQADEISLRVKKDGIVNAINLSTEEAKIAAARITLAGATIADSFTATNLHVTGNSVFDGVLNGATGSFSGAVTTSNIIATGGTIGGWSITSSRIRTSSTIYMGAKEAGMMLINESTAPYIYAQDANGSPTFQVTRDGSVSLTGSVTAKSLTAYDNVKVYDSTSGKTHTALSAFYTSETSGVMIGSGSSEVRCATFFWSYGNILSNGSITASSSFKVGSTSYNNGYVELYGNTPYIDFHFKNSTADYTSRIIESTSGVLTVTGGLTVEGELKFTDYNGTSRRPISSASTDSNRVSYIASKVNSSGTYYITVQGQFGTTGSTYDAKNISTNTSDVRLKCNIVDTKVVALPVINQMAIRAFDWLESGIHRSIGFVADELEAIDPALAFGGGYDDDGTMIEKNVDVFYLAGYLTKGIQELYSAQVEMDERLVVVESWKESVEDQLMDAREEIVELRTELAEARNEIEQLKSQASAA